jgi:hypothetical protein
LPLEKRMLLHVNYDVKVTGGAVMQSGFSLALDAQSCAVVHAGWNPYFKHLFPSNAPSALAGFARFANHPACSAALATGSADGKKTLLVTHLPGAMACGTANRIFALRCSASITSAACILTRDFYFGLEAEGGLAERNFQVIAEIGASFRTTAPAPAKDVAKSKKFAKYVAEVAKGGRVEAAKSTLKPAVTIAIVTRALIRIAQDAICLRGFFESFLGIFIVRILIGMIFKSQFPVGAFNLLIRGVMGNPKYFVAISLIIQKQSPLF